MTSALRRLKDRAAWMLQVSKQMLKPGAHSFMAGLNRESIAKMYLQGSGIEIGALHNPLKVPKSARVKYVDRMPVPELRKQYIELNTFELVPVDILDNGERLETIQDATQDFVIANHFLEHCQDPTRAIGNMLRVLKPGGILYLAVPDKRYTFDADRPVTAVEHFTRDHLEGPEWSKRQHFHEWVTLVLKTQGETEVEQQVAHLMNMDYSIHFHVWTQVEMFEFIAGLRKRFDLNFDVELFLKNDTEMILILRKAERV
jgi:predicted SAM-dependent methyltransferase